MKERVLVTGASGFLGRRLVSRLEKERHVVLGAALHTRPGTKDHSLNILSNDAVRNLIDDFKPDWIFHLAAQTIPRQSWQNIAGTFETNVQGTLNFLEALRLQKRKTRFFFASTIQVYGRLFANQKKLSESEIFWPDSPYAASKAVAELVLVDYAKRFKLDVVVGRFANSVGKGQPAQLVFPEWCRQIARIESGVQPPVLETGNLNVKRDFLDVEDTVSAMLVIMKKGRGGQVYNVASGKPQLLKKYVSVLTGQAAKKIALKKKAGRVLNFDPLSIEIDSRKLRNLGWRPCRKVEHSLQDLLNEWRLRERETQ